MNGMLIDELDDALITNIVGDQIHVWGDISGCVILVLEESESGPFRMTLPKFENGLSALEKTIARARFKKQNPGLQISNHKKYKSKKAA